MENKNEIHFYWHYMKHYDMRFEREICPGNILKEKNTGQNCNRLREGFKNLKKCESIAFGHRGGPLQLLYLAILFLKFQSFVWGEIYVEFMRSRGIQLFKISKKVENLIEISAIKKIKMQ